MICFARHLDSYIILEYNKVKLPGGFSKNTFVETLAYVITLMYFAADYLV